MAVSKTLRYQILRRDNSTCRTCGRSALEVKLHIDHVVPEALGGRTEPANLQTLCSDCNSGKSATPADAARVDEVSADARRWADAQKVVVAQLLVEVRGRNQIYEQFDRLWHEYGDIYRPSSWRHSIDQFLDAGLPPELVMRAADVALSKQRIRASDCFKYMCGIAWARIAEIREATANVVAPRQEQKESANSRAERDEWEVRGWNDGRSELAEEILENFNEEERAELLRTARMEALEEGDDLSDDSDDSPYLLGRAASLAFTDVHDEVCTYKYMTREVLSGLPRDLRERVMERARQDMTVHHPEGFKDHELRKWAIFCLGYELADGSEEDVPWTEAA